MSAIGKRGKPAEGLSWVGSRQDNHQSALSRGIAKDNAMMIADDHRLRCRPAVAADLDVVADVWHESARAMDGAPPELPTRDQLRSRIDEELLSGWDLHVAVQDGETVGMLALKPAEAILDQLFVLPGVQRRGVGLMLLKTAVESMPEGFTLRTASVNRKARSFYQKAGLNLLNESSHPRTGAPVCIYGYAAAKGRKRP
jgi:GNAT superfamily N-acetyltransferase